MPSIPAWIFEPHLIVPVVSWQIHFYLSAAISAMTDANSIRVDIVVTCMILMSLTEHIKAVPSVAKLSKVEVADAVLRQGRP